MHRVAGFRQTADGGGWKATGAVRNSLATPITAMTIVAVADTTALRVRPRRDAADLIFSSYGKQQGNGREGGEQIAASCLPVQASAVRDFDVVPLVGIELTTFRLQGGCSTN